MNLSVESFIVLVIVGGLIGVIAEHLAGYSHAGCLTSVALGFIGALIGSWAVHQFKLPEIYMLQVGSTRFPLVWAIIGATVLVLLLRLLKRRRVL